jgi:hypothetical protein
MQSYVYWFLVALGVVGIVAAAASVLWFKRDWKQGAVVLAASALLLLASRLDHITALSFAGAEARLDRKVEEADEALKELKEAMAAFSNAVLTVSIANDFFDGISTRKRFELYDQVMVSLRDFDLSDAQLKTAERGWQQGVAILYHRVLGNVMQEQLASSDRSKDEQREMVRRLWELGDFKTWTSPSAGEFRDFFKREGVLSPELELWLADYENFLASGEVRRRDSFLYEASEKQRSSN